MAGGGYYPIMSDSEWANAPWNETETKYRLCPNCNGDRGVWYDDDDKKYSVADYERMSEEERKDLEFEKCKYCDGDGEIPVD